jgi:chromosome segregation ATPase
MTRYFALFVFGTVGFAQSPEAVLTQTLINEIHALRQELEATNITSQRVQIALFRLQSQTAIVNTAQQRLDAARIAAADTSGNLQHLRTQIAGAEERLRSLPEGPEKKALGEEELPRARMGLQRLTSEDAVRRTAEVEAESQLRAERARLADLQALLDRLDKALDELARPKVR